MYNRINDLSEVARKRFENPISERKTGWRKPIKGPKVTIAIGFITRATTPKRGEVSAVYMACDSQSTYGETKRLNPNKLNKIDFANGRILVAQADSVELGDRTIEKLRRMAATITITDSETAIKTVRAALLEVRNELLEWNNGCNIDLEKFFWTEHRLNLLVGYCFKRKPYLFKMDIYRGIYSAVDSFEAIGAGQSLGYFLLKEYARATPDFDYPFPVAVSVVEKVIDNVDGCGRPTWVGYVHSANAVTSHYR